MIRKKGIGLILIACITVAFLVMAQADTLAGFIDDWRIEIGEWKTTSGYNWTAPKSVTSTTSNGNIYVLTGAQVVGGGGGAVNAAKSYKIALNGTSVTTTSAVIANGTYSVRRNCKFTAVKNHTYTMWHIRADVDLTSLCIYQGDTFIYFK